LTLKVPIQKFLNISEFDFFSQVRVKVHRTGQEIKPYETTYVTIYKQSADSYLLAYTFYSTQTRMVLRCERNNEITVKVEDYRQGPVFRTRCDIYLVDKKILENVDEKTIGSKYIHKQRAVLEPSAPYRAGIIYDAPKKQFQAKPTEDIWVNVDKPTIFIGTPIYYTAERTLSQFVEGLNRLDTSMVKDIVHYYVDDSLDPGWHKKIPASKIRTIVLYNSLPKEFNSRYRITAAQNIMRDRFFLENMDYFLMLESDIILKGNELSELLLANADVASGVCGYRKSTFWWSRVDFGDGGILQSEFSGQKGLRFRRWSLSEGDEKEFRFVPITGFAFGLTLFKRKVIEAIPFEHDPRFLDHSDVFYVRRCCEQGLNMIGCRDAVPDHLDVGGGKPNY